MAEDHAIDESIVANGSLVNRVSFLEELPPELLHRIFEYALPHGFTFSFRHIGGDNFDLLAARGNHTQWVIGSPKGRYSSRHDRWYNDACTVCESAPDCEETISRDEMQVGILLVNKAFAQEARASLFANNTFCVHITDYPHYPVSLKSPLIFGPLGLPHRIHLLRDLRRIELTLKIGKMTSWGKARLRARTQHFVDILREHSGDVNKQSLLTQLRVYIKDSGSEPHSRCCRPRWGVDVSRCWDKLHKPTVPDQLMFVLEPLVALQGIQDIAVYGAPEWFQRCLEMCIRGQGGDLKTLDWPTKLVRRKKKGSSNKVKVEVSKRQGWQPIFDWKRFAVRNEIPLPDDIHKLLPSPQNEESE